jgi:hypothetical protein
MRIYSLGVARNLIAEKNGKGFALGAFMLLEDEAKARAKAAVKAALNHVFELNEDERTIMSIVMGGYAPPLDDADIAAALRDAMSALARHRS